MRSNSLTSNVSESSEDKSVSSRKSLPSLPDETNLVPEISEIVEPTENAGLSSPITSTFIHISDLVSTPIENNEQSAQSNYKSPDTVPLNQASVLNIIKNRSNQSKRWMRHSPTNRHKRTKNNLSFYNQNKPSHLPNFSITHCLNPMQNIYLNNFETNYSMIEQYLPAHFIEHLKENVVNQYIFNALFNSFYDALNHVNSNDNQFFNQYPNY